VPLTCHVDLCLAKIKSAFEINKIKKRDVTMLHAIWLSEITIRHRALPFPWSVRKNPQRFAFTRIEAWKRGAMPPESMTRKRICVSMKAA
jgi:hypothetical protein